MKTMRSAQDWLDEYSESHQNPVNKAVHWICVPLIARRPSVNWPG